MLDNATYVKVALMDEATIDGAHLLRLPDLNLLRDAIENVRKLFGSLGGALRNMLTAAPIERSGRFFALANWILLRSPQRARRDAIHTMCNALQCATDGNAQHDTVCN
jgi:hypothetical protein